MCQLPKALEAPGGNIPFSLEPILVELEGARCVGPILPVPLVDLLAGIILARGVGNIGGGSGGGGGIDNGGGSSIRGSSGFSSGGGNSGSGGVFAVKGEMFGTPGGGARVQARYNAHLPAISLQYRENSRNLLAGNFLPALRGHVICKNFLLCVGGGGVGGL